MAAKLTVATELANRDLANEVAAMLKNISDVVRIDWQNGVGEKGALASKTMPHVIILDEAPQYGTLYERVSRLRSAYPYVTVFVVSLNQQPEQIVEAMKAGAAEFFIHPLQPKLIEKAVNDVRAKLAKEGHMAKGRVFSFVSAKGGAGATVLATNSAVSLGKNSKQSVALCDLSYQSGDSTVLLDLQPRTDLADVSENFHRLDAALLKDCMTQHETGIQLLAAPNLPERSEEVRPEHVSRIMDLLKQLYEMVIVDCASMFVNECEVESFRYSEKIFIVTELSLPALRNASRLKRLITEVGISKDKVEFVVNRYHKGSTLSIESAEETLKKKIFWLFPNDYTDVMQSINRGSPIVQLLPQSQLATNITAFVERILNPSAAGDFRGIRGMFGKAV